MCPHNNTCTHVHVHVVAEKQWNPQGFTSSTIVVLIACQIRIHVGLEWGSQGFTLENCHQILLCKVYGDKSDDSAVYLGM